MLEFLKISNLALLESASLDFKTGFTAITGETGAGKSVVLGALALLAGSRVSKEIIRLNAQACCVEAIINTSNIKNIDEILDSFGLNPCENNSLIISRTIFKNKSPRILVNSSITTLSVLSELGQYWVDFHGPNEPQKLLNSKYQLSFLDSFISATDVLNAYLELFDVRKNILKSIETLKNSKQLNADEAEFIQSQIDKIDELNLSEESLLELETNFKVAQMTTEILDKSTKIYSYIFDELGINELLVRSIKEASSLNLAGENFENLSKRLEDIFVEISDIAQEYQNIAQNSNFSEGDIAKINEKMSKWLALSRKYGANFADVDNAKQSMLEKLNSQVDVASKIEELLSQEEVILKQMNEIADKLFVLRNKNKDKLQVKVEALLAKLGFKKARFEIDVVKEAQASANGQSFCNFMFSANAGQNVMELSKIASSGELARVMLALKTTLAQEDNTPLLVFDEVDANVGGEIGNQIGKEMAVLAEKHQVLCVTHLPQVASWAKNHFLIEKTQSESDTNVFISSLDYQARIDELARMLGDRYSSSAKTHAKKLLDK